MSELQIALVCEGPTDRLVIEAVLLHFLPAPFQLTSLQPDSSETFGPSGTGWTGVYQWCRQLEQTPLLRSFDLLILHLDTDVAHKTYASGNILPEPDELLPSACECPPAQACAEVLKNVVASWLGKPHQAFPAHWVFCLPAQAMEAWGIVALYGEQQAEILAQLECRTGLESWIKSRPKQERDHLKKKTGAYRTLAPQIANAWQRVEQHCSQARQFAQDLQTALGRV